VSFITSLSALTTGFLAAASATMLNVIDTIKANTD